MVKQLQFVFTFADKRLVKLIFFVIKYIPQHIMLVTGNTFGYTGHKKHVTRRGVVDSAASIFRNIRSYIGTNKDVIAKPLLSAVGSLGAFNKWVSLHSYITS